MEALAVVRLPRTLRGTLLNEGKELLECGLDFLDTLEDFSTRLRGGGCILAIDDDLKRVANLVVEVGDAAEIIPQFAVAVAGPGESKDGKECGKDSNEKGVGQCLREGRGLQRVGGEMEHRLNESGGDAEEENGAGDPQRSLKDPEESFLELGAEFGNQHTLQTAIHC